MSSKRIKGYFLRVGEESEHFKGYTAEFEDTLEYLQKYVGGYMDVIAMDNGVDLVINDEGKIQSLPLNRAIRTDTGEIADFICGNILCVRHDEEGEFISILEEDIPEIEKRLIPLLSVGAVEDRTVFVLTNADTLPEYKEADL